MGLPQARWMVYFMDNPTKMDDDWGYPYDYGSHHVVMTSTVLTPLKCLISVMLPSGYSTVCYESHGMPSPFCCSMMMIYLFQIVIVHSYIA